MLARIASTLNKMLHASRSPHGCGTRTLGLSFVLNLGLGFVLSGIQDGLRIVKCLGLALGLRRQVQGGPGDDGFGLGQS